MDHIVLDSGLVVSYTRSHTRILQLQELHGVGNVVYSSPIVELHAEPSRHNITRVSIFNLSRDRFYEIEVQTALIESGYDCEVDIYEELDYVGISESDIVILIGGTMFSFFSVLAKNFILYKWQSNYYLRENNLERRIAQDERQLTELLCSNTRDIEIRTEYRNILASYLGLYRHLQLGTEAKDIFYVDRSLYSGTLATLAETFWVDGASARNGVYLDIAVVRTFHVYQRPHFYPWVGILEVSDLEDVRSFLLSDIFRLSESFCLGLVTFSQSIANIIDKRVPTLVLSRLVKFEGKQWDYSKWVQKPTVVSIDLSGKCTVLELATGNKTISTSIQECLQTSVLVLTNKTEPYLGTLSLALGMCTPIVVQKKHVLISYFESNPLNLARLNYSALKFALTPELVQQGYNWMCAQKKMYDIEFLLRKLKSTSIGLGIRSLLEYSRLF